MGLTQKLGTIPLAIQTDSSNNVGIGGAANASYKLAVTGATLTTGAATFSSSVLVNGTSGGNAISSLNVKTGGTKILAIEAIAPSGNKSIYIKPVDSGIHLISSNYLSSGPYLSLALSARENTSDFVLTNTGNVGIGTSSPDWPLTIKTDASANSLKIIGRTGGDNAVGFYGSDASTLYGHIDVGASYFQIHTSNSQPMQFYTGGSERMRITSSGNVLIGTTSTALLGLGTIQYGTNNTSNPTLLVRNGGGSAAFLSFSDSDGATTLFGWVVRSGSGVNYASASDYRLKQDLKEYEGLSLISKIKTYDYEWKSDNSRSYGVIAHELQEVIPYAVTGEKDGENMQGVDYSKIVPILVKAIQELSQEVNELKAKLA